MSESPESIPVTARDFLGNLITANDTIVYPVRRGSSMWMNSLVVQAVRDTGAGVRVTGVNDAGRPIQIQNLGNVIVVTAILPKNTNRGDAPENSPEGN